MSRRAGGREGWRLAFAVVMVVSLVLRLFLAFAQTDFPRWPDGDHYLSIAHNLKDGYGYRSDAPHATLGSLRPDVGPTSFWLPGYPLLLAGSFTLFGSTPRSVFVVQGLLSTLAVFGTGLLGRRLGGWPLATGAAALMALSPMQLVNVDRLTTETLATLLFVLLVIMASRVSGRGKRRVGPDAAALGAVIGLGVLTRSAFVLPGALALLLVGWRLRRSASTRAALSVTAIAAGVAAVVILPWLVRNAVLWGEPVYQTKSGANMVIGFSDVADGSYVTSAVPRLPPERFDELARNQRLVAQAHDWIRTHPLASIRLGLEKILLFWSPFHDYKPVTSLGGGLVFAWSAPVLLLALVQLVWVVRERLWDWAGPVLLTLAYATTHAAAFSAVRFRVPVEPVLALLAAAPCVRLLTRLRAGSRRA